MCCPLCFPAPLLGDAPFGHEAAAIAPQWARASGPFMAFVIIGEVGSFVDGGGVELSLGPSAGGIDRPRCALRCNQLG
jgi:hypothetical protein